MVSDRAVEMLRPAMSALVPARDLSRARSVDAAITPQGDVITEAIREETLWQRVTWYVSSPAAGSNVAEAFRVPNGGVARLISVYARTAPSSGGFSAAIACTGWSGTEGVNLIQGTSSGQSTQLTNDMNPGAVLTLNITSVNGAAGVTVELFYAPQRST